MNVAQLILVASSLACVCIEILGFGMARRVGYDRHLFRMEGTRDPLRSILLERKAVLYRSIGILTGVLLLAFVLLFIGITYYEAGTQGRGAFVTAGYFCLLAVPFILCIYMIYDFVNDGETLRIADSEAARLLQEKEKEARNA